MKEPQCQTCGFSKRSVKFDEVPKEDRTWYSCYGDLLNIRQGWFHCVECNDWTHEPSVTMFRYRAGHMGRH
jgi:hypothetical protein